MDRLLPGGVGLGDVDSRVEEDAHDACMPFVDRVVEEGLADAGFVDVDVCAALDEEGDDIFVAGADGPEDCGFASGDVGGVDEGAVVEEETGYWERAVSGRVVEGGGTRGEGTRGGGCAPGEEGPGEGFVAVFGGPGEGGLVVGCEGFEGAEGVEGGEEEDREGAGGED